MIFVILVFDLVVIIVMVTWTEVARMPEQEVKTEMEQPPVQTYNLLAPTGALIVMICYYTTHVQLFEFSLSPLMQLILQVPL